MKSKDLLYAVFPVLGNKSVNDKLRNKLKDSNAPDAKELQTPLSLSTNPDAITNESLKQQYLDALKAKDKFEDKAKATIVCVTVSVSLIMGASGLLTTVASRFDFLVIRWLSYVLFLYAVLSMISAAIMDIKVIANENIIYIFPADCPEESIRETYDLCIGQNVTQNYIRNNYVFTAYECIRNALICLFVIMALAVIPLQDTKTGHDSVDHMNTARDYSYSEPTLDSLEKHNASDVKGIIESALPSLQTESNRTYSIVDSEKKLFIKFQIWGNDIKVLSIEEISWEQ